MRPYVITVCRDFSALSIFLIFLFLPLKQTFVYRKFELGCLGSPHVLMYKEEYVLYIMSQT